MNNTLEIIKRKAVNISCSSEKTGGFIRASVSVSKTLHPEKPIARIAAAAKRIIFFKNKTPLFHKYYNILLYNIIQIRFPCQSISCKHYVKSKKSPGFLLNIS